MHRIYKSRFFFDQWTAKITEDFATLFGSDGSATEHEQRFSTNWGYYIWIMALTGEDPTKIKEAVGMNVREALTFLAYNTSKNKMIEAIRKENERKLR